MDRLTLFTSLAQGDRFTIGLGTRRFVKTGSQDAIDSDGQTQTVNPGTFVYLLPTRWNVARYNPKTCITTTIGTHAIGTSNGQTRHIGHVLFYVFKNLSFKHIISPNV